LSVNVALSSIIQELKESHPEVKALITEQLSGGLPPERDSAQGASNNYLLVFRSKRANETFYPQTQYRVEVDFPERVEFFKFLTNNKNFVLVHPERTDQPDTSRSKVFTLFQFTKIDKIKSQSIVVTAMALKFVKVSHLDSYQYGSAQGQDQDNNQSEQPIQRETDTPQGQPVEKDLDCSEERDGVLPEDQAEDNLKENKKQLLIKRKLIPELHNKRGETEMKGKVEFCQYEQFDYSIEGSYGPETPLGRTALFVYEQLNKQIWKLKESNPHVFNSLLAKHQLDYGEDRILTDSLRQKVSEELGVAIEDPQVRNKKQLGIKVNVFESPLTFGYLLPMLLEFDPKTLKEFPARRSLNFILGESTKLLQNADQNDPVFLFQISQNQYTFYLFEVISRHISLFVTLLLFLLAYQMYFSEY
jgi:hypothetical protein